jgi:hypothetical protein
VFQVDEVLVRQSVILMPHSFLLWNARTFEDISIESTYMYICIHLWHLMYTPIFIYLYIYMCIYIWYYFLLSNARSFEDISIKSTYSYVYVNVYIYPFVPIYVYVHLYKCIYRYMYICTCIYMPHYFLLWNARTFQVISIESIYIYTYIYVYLYICIQPSKISA